MLYRKCVVTLTNDFHNTETKVNAFFQAGSDLILITKDQAKRAWKNLCGHKECTCGDVAGCRPQQAEAVPPGHRFMAVYAKPDKVFDGFYQWEYPATKEGRLIKQQGTKNL